MSEDEEPEDEPADRDRSFFSFETSFGVACSFFFGSSWFDEELEFEFDSLESELEEESSSLSLSEEEEEDELS